MSINPAPDQKFILELTRQELHDLWLACCDGRKHKRYRMETPNAWPVHNLAAMRSALRRLEELEKRLGQAASAPWLQGLRGEPLLGHPYVG